MSAKRDYYEILGVAQDASADGNKRATYDRFGHAGLQGGAADFSGVGVGDIFSQFQDIFADFFGDQRGGGRGRRQARGADVRVDARITLRDSMVGVKHEVTVEGLAPCDGCKGSGAAPGTTPETCRTCQGSGQVATQRGFIMFSSTCPTCRGQGTLISTPCSACSGRGAVERQRKGIVTFPAA